MELIINAERFDFIVSDSDKHVRVQVEHGEQKCVQMILN